MCSIFKCRSKETRFSSFAKFKRSWLSFNKSTEGGRGQRHQLHPEYLPPPFPILTHVLPSDAMRAYKFARVARPLYARRQSPPNGRNGGPRRFLPRGFLTSRGRRGGEGGPLPRPARARGAYSPVRAADAQLPRGVATGTGPVHPVERTILRGKHLALTCFPPRFQYPRAPADTHRQPPGRNTSIDTICIDMRLSRIALDVISRRVYLCDSSAASWFFGLSRF